MTFSSGVQYQGYDYLIFINRMARCTLTNSIPAAIPFFKPCGTAYLQAIQHNFRRLLVAPSMDRNISRKMSRYPFPHNVRSTVIVSFLLPLIKTMNRLKQASPYAFVLRMISFTLKLRQSGSSKTFQKTNIASRAYKFRRKTVMTVCT